MAQDMDYIFKNRTWSFMDLPLAKRPINVQWVYQIKLTLDGKPNKFKMRLMAKGYE